MRKTVISGALIAGLFFAQAAIAASGNGAQIKALHGQEKTLKARMQTNPSQIPAILKQLRAVRGQERALRQANIQTHMAAHRAGN